MYMSQDEMNERLNLATTAQKIDVLARFILITTPFPSREAYEAEVADCASHITKVPGASHRFAVEGYEHPGKPGNMTWMDCEYYVVDIRDPSISAVTRLLGTEVSFKAGGPTFRIDRKLH